MADQADQDGLFGRNIGDFVVGKLIGEGGFGRVYRGEQPTLGREVVIKVLHDRQRARDDLLQRFLREAQLASRLAHPYAAHIYGFDGRWGERRAGLDRHGVRPWHHAQALAARARHYPAEGS